MTKLLAVKTLIFCTSYFDNKDIYRKRYLKWIEYYKNHCFSENKELFLIDDGSDTDCVEDPVHLVYDDQIGNFQDLHKVNMVHFHKRKGINPEDNTLGLGGSTTGWYRSFFKSLEIAKVYNYNKIVHIESDAYLISKRMFDYIDNFNEGWLSMWCPRHGFPESSIQVICEDQFNKFKEIINLGEDFFKGKQAERSLPFTHVEKAFVGDRFGEVMNAQRRGMDYFCQCHLNQTITPE